MRSISVHITPIPFINEIYIQQPPPPIRARIGVVPMEFIYTPLTVLYPYALKICIYICTRNAGNTARTVYLLPNRNIPTLRIIVNGAQFRLCILPQEITRKHVQQTKINRAKCITGQFIQSSDPHHLEDCIDTKVPLFHTAFSLFHNNNRYPSYFFVFVNRHP